MKRRGKSVAEPVSDAGLTMKKKISFSSYLEEHNKKRSSKEKTGRPSL